MLLHGRIRWRAPNEQGRWWAFRCDGCGNERAMRAATAKEAAWGLGLKTVRIADAEDRLEHYCRACQRKGA